MADPLRIINKSTLCQTILLTVTLLATGCRPVHAQSTLSQVSMAMPQIDPFNSASFAQVSY